MSQYVQGEFNQVSGLTTNTRPFSSANTSANQLLVIATAKKTSGAVPSLTIADSNENLYTPIIDNELWDNGTRTYCAWYCQSAAAGNNTVEATANTALNTDFDLTIIELEGAEDFDNFSFNQGLGPNGTSGLTNLRASNEFIVSAYLTAEVNGVAITDGSDVVFTSSDGSNTIGVRESGTIGSYAATGTVSASTYYAFLIIGFRSTPVVPPSPPTGKLRFGLQMFIDNGDGPVDYTRYVMSGTIQITDAINMPTLLNFSLANVDGAFQVPLLGAYVQLWSNKKQAYLATGFVSVEPNQSFLGSGQQSGNFGYNSYQWDFTVASDEWLLNVKSTPFIPNFINQTQGQILTTLAETLAPGFFNTSQIQDGDLVAYLAYDPTQKWADIAKSFGDASRYRYKALNKVIFYCPYGDAPLGVSYNESELPGSFDPSGLTSSILAVPIVNDAIVIGDTEPQNYHDDNFVGDGTTGDFNLRHQLFGGGSAGGGNQGGAANILLEEDWTETQRNLLQNWNVFDPSGAIDLTNGSLQVIGGIGLGQTYLMYQNGVELGGVVTFQHGEFFFFDTNTGQMGGIYVDQEAGNCLVGFDVRPVSTVVVTISGASGMNITPIINNELVGPAVPILVNHHYQLQTQIAAQRALAYNVVYRTLEGTPFGGEGLPSVPLVTFIITDINIADPLNPITTQFDTSLDEDIYPGIVVPSFAYYAPINSVDMNLTLNYTAIYKPPQAILTAAALTGSPGGNIIATDYFDEPDGTTLDNIYNAYTNWGISPSPGLFVIYDGQVSCFATGGGVTQAVAFWTASPVPNNQFVEITVNKSSFPDTGFGQFGVVARLNTGNNPNPNQLVTNFTTLQQFYSFIIKENLHQLWLGITGDNSLGVVNGYFLTDGDVLRLEVVGEFLTAYLNGKVVLNVQDFNNTCVGGQFGIYGGTSAIYAGSNFIGGSFEAFGAGLAVLPVAQPVGPYIGYLLGFEMENQVATIANVGDFDQLQFYTDSIPAAGSRIKLKSWEAGQSVARVQDPVNIAEQALIDGDDGLRTAIFQSLVPLPRSSADCAAAAQATIIDRENPQYQGTYTITDDFLVELNNYFDYPVPGRFLSVYSPQRDITGNPVNPNYIQSALSNIVTSGKTATIEFENSVSDGDAIIICIVAAAATGAPTIRDTLNNPYTNITPPALAAVGAYIFQSQDVEAGGTTITITTPNNSDISAIAQEIYGTSAVDGVVVTSSGSSTGPFMSGVLNTSAVKDFILGFALFGNSAATLTPDNLSQEINNTTSPAGYAMQTQFRLASIAGEYTTSWFPDANSTYLTAAIAFRPAVPSGESLATPALVQYSSAQNDGTSNVLEVPFGLNVTGNNSIVLCIVATDSTTPTPTVEDTNGNLYVNISPADLAGSGVWIFGVQGVKSGPTTAIITMDSPNTIAALAQEIYGTSFKVDASAVKQGITGSTFNAGNLVTNSARDFIFGFVIIPETGVTIASEYPSVMSTEIIAPDIGLLLQIQYQLAGEPGTYTSGWTPSGDTEYLAIALALEPIKVPQGENFLVTQTVITVEEMFDEHLDIQIQFGQDLFLNKLMKNFVSKAVSATANILEPSDTAVAPTPLQISEVASAYLDDLPSCQVLPGGFSGSQFIVDLGTVPITGAEVRRSDNGWGVSPVGLIQVATTQQFIMARQNYEDIFYIRQVNGALSSRFTSVIRIVAPLSPPTPSATLDTTDIQNPIITCQYTGDVRNLRFIEIRAGDNQSILFQRTFTSYNDLIFTVDNSLQLTLDLEFYIYYVNLLGEYSQPLFLEAEQIISSIGILAELVGPNLITNPGFESNKAAYPRVALPCDGHLVSDNWAAVDTSSPANATGFFVGEVTTVSPRTGKWCAHLRVPAEFKSYPASGDEARIMWPAGVLQQVPLGLQPGVKGFPVRGGDWYYFGGYAQWQADTTMPAGVSGFAGFELDFFDANGYQIPFDDGGTVQTEPITGPTDDEYVYLDALTQVPLNASQVTFSFFGEIENPNPFTTGFSKFMDCYADDVFLQKANRGTHATYRPLSNPLTAHDAGTSAEIEVAQFTMQSGSSQVICDAGVITLLEYNTLYFVYYDDPDFAGGDVTYNATTVKEDALFTENRFFVGSIQTPRQGAPGTTGNNDGGSGAQDGMLNVLSMTLASIQASGGTITSLSNMCDGDLTTYGTMTYTGSGSPQNLTLDFSGPPGITRRYASSVLKMLVAAPIASLSDPGAAAVATVRWGLADRPFDPVPILGTIDLWLSGDPTFTATLFDVVLPANINLGNVYVDLSIVSNDSNASHSLELQIFEIWIEAIE